MFGRVLDVYISNEESEIHLVNSEHGSNALICEGDIQCMPNKEKTSLVLKIYNLSLDVRKTIKSGNYKYINVKFGYKDLDGGVASSIFNGTLKRMITQRPSPETSVTIMYAYELGDAYDYGFFSGTFDAGTTLYDACNTVATMGEQKIPIYITESFKDYCFTKSVSFYNSQITILQQLASYVNNTLFMQSMGKVYITTAKENDKTEVIVMSGVNERGELISSSGIIGLPSLNDDGLNFDCLINPRLHIYSTVLIANSFISDAQEGFEAQSIAGAVYDENGLYVVTKISTHFANNAQECKMKVTALARSYYLGEA